ncbi:GNAT family N-acetyltransferase [Bacillus lacus]|uniref:GNAT family N-acetyltransferase n=1 Tax=Metabacillus lacus TaxID=1983721 RepID=A0A7X2J378_9BACI|nr:GNAT family N-acetyltransferase [Metabacillus lacus]MRX74397.1 GNAT family N-acetyltransferase [Metabacillus lacus]
MIKIVQAEPVHAESIVQVCIEANRHTYQNLYSEETLKRIIGEFYYFDRIMDEILNTGREWNGWLAALDGEAVVGAIGGGLIDDRNAEIFVLYLNPFRRGEGIGTLLLYAYTELQRKWGAENQWVSVAEGNEKGIPFYEARGFQFVEQQKAYSSLEEENYTSLRYRRNIAEV